MLKGAVAGTSPTGPWTDGRTGARTPDDDEVGGWVGGWVKENKTAHCEEKVSGAKLGFLGKPGFGWFPKLRFPPDTAQ